MPLYDIMYGKRVLMTRFYSTQAENITSKSEHYREEKRREERRREEKTRHQTRSYLHSRRALLANMYVRTARATVAALCNR
jgi:hypothetical protein